MAIDLLPGIARYFDADRRRDAVAIAECFTADATVQDEGHTYTGRDGIQEWAVGYLAKYLCATEPFAITDKGNKAVVTSHVVGNFPGSLVDLRYEFTLADGAIAGLEIAL